MQSRYAAIRQREIDRPPGCDFFKPHIAARFIYIDLDPTFCKIYRKQRTREPCADDDYSRHSFKISAKRNISPKELYNGAGATRITSGSRQSANTARDTTHSCSDLSPPRTRIESWQPRSFGSL